MGAAAGALRPRPEPPAVAKQERAAICAIILQSVGWGHGDYGRRSQASAGAAVAAAAAGASAGAAPSQRRRSRSHRHSNPTQTNPPKQNANQTIPSNGYRHRRNCEAGPLNPKLIAVHHAHHDRQRWTHSSHSFALNRSAQNSTRPSKMAPMTSSVIAY